VLDVLYVTDPSCPWSWGAEPLRRRVEREFDAGVRTTCVMGGPAREFGPPEALVAEWLDAGDASGMPVDPRLWWEGPPRSSFPACLAVVAAREQGFDKALLRRLRVGLMTARRKLDTTEALLAPGTAINLRGGWEEVQDGLRAAGAEPAVPGENARGGGRPAPGGTARPARGGGPLRSPRAAGYGRALAADAGMPRAARAAPHGRALVGGLGDVPRDVPNAG